MATYEELFENEHEKAEAFDKIAEKFFRANFGSTSKADLEVLIFSLYIDQIRKKCEDDISKYNDYNLSKQLGITQTRVSSLKVRKELMYPAANYDWKKELRIVSNNAYLEGDDIFLKIPNKSVYLEIKNIIEENGGFVIGNLTPSLLQVKLAYFLDLMISVDGRADRYELLEKIKSKVKENTTDVEYIDNEPFGNALLNQTPDMIINIIEKCIPVIGGVVGEILKNVYEAIKKSRKGKK